MPEQSRCRSNDDDHADWEGYVRRVIAERVKAMVAAPFASATIDFSDGRETTHFQTSSQPG
jgi:hypothetical protein